MFKSYDIESELVPVLISAWSNGQIRHVEGKVLPEDAIETPDGLFRLYVKGKEVCIPTSNVIMYSMEVDAATYLVTNLEDMPYDPIVKDATVELYIKDEGRLVHHIGNVFKTSSGTQYTTIAYLFEEKVKYTVIKNDYIHTIEYIQRPSKHKIKVLMNQDLLEGANIDNFYDKVYKRIVIDNYLSFKLFKNIYDYGWYNYSSEEMTRAINFIFDKPSKGGDTDGDIFPDPTTSIYTDFSHEDTPIEINDEDLEEAKITSHEYNEGVKEIENTLEALGELDYSDFREAILDSKGEGTIGILFDSYKEENEDQDAPMEQSIKNFREFVEAQKEDK